MAYLISISKEDVIEINEVIIKVNNHGYNYVELGGKKVYVSKDRLQFKNTKVWVDDVKDIPKALDVFESYYNRNVICHKRDMESAQRRLDLVRKYKSDNKGVIKWQSSIM